MKVDVIIPVYGPGNRLLELFDRLGRQTVPVDRLIIMNTEKYRKIRKRCSGEIRCIFF